jgi:hypothetical protein
MVALAASSRALFGKTEYGLPSQAVHIGAIIEAIAGRARVGLGLQVGYT